MALNECKAVHVQKSQVNKLDEFMIGLAFLLAHFKNGPSFIVKI